MQPLYCPLLAWVNFHANETCQRNPLDRRYRRTGMPTAPSSAKMFGVVPSIPDVKIDFLLSPEVAELFAQI